MTIIVLCLIGLVLMVLYAFEFPKVVDDVAGVPEKFRPFYTKGADGKFALDDELHAKVDNSGLVTALDKERKRAKDLEKHVNGWKGLKLGETPEEALAALKEAMGDDGEDDADDDVPVKEKGKRQMQKIKADAEQALLATKNEYEQKLQTMQGTLKKHLIESQATAAIAEAKGVPALLLPHVMAKCLLIEEDGQHVVRVVDAEGDPRSNGKGGYMTVEDLVAEMRKSEVFGRAFEADGKAGSGTRQSQGTGGAGKAPLTSIQKISRGLNSQRK